VLDQLTLLVDKSLVIADASSGRTRYRLLETVRQYALEKLGDSGEADSVRSRHCDHYTSIAALLDAPARTDHEQRLEQAEVEMDNLRNALGWHLENRDTERALALASSLQPVWLTRGRILEGVAWFDVIPAEGHASAVAPVVRARALADKAVLDMYMGKERLEHVRRALDIARELEDPALLARTLTACGYIAGARYDVTGAAAYYSEALELARELDDKWVLSQILAWQANTGMGIGDPVSAEAAGVEGRELADAIGDRGNSRLSRNGMGWAHLLKGDLVAALAQFNEVRIECEQAHDEVHRPMALMSLGIALGYHGEVDAALGTAREALDGAAALGEFFVGLASAQLAQASLAAGDVEAAAQASESAWLGLRVAQPEMADAQRVFNSVEIALARGDLAKAREWADRAIEVAAHWHRVAALLVRARIAIADGAPDDAERLAHDALICATSSGARLNIPDVIEVLAGLATRDGNHSEAARLFGAAQGLRQRTGLVRFKIHEAAYQESVQLLRDAMEVNEFEAAWAAGAALTADEVIAYAQRGRGQRKRPASGWQSLTPAERDVARSVCEGLANKDIATRLFVSPRTVQAHLTHIYTKLGIASRVQLVQEAARHS
jgi:DNA-binding CsgD family transcriptional regulator